MRFFAIAAAAMAIVATMDAALVHSAPIVKIRARTEIHVDSVRRVGERAEVKGTVVDVYSQQPVSHVEIKVRMNDLEEYVRTDDDGAFTAWFYVEDGRHDVSVEFAGEEYYDRSESAMSGVDVSKQSLELQISAHDVSYSKETIEVVVKAGNEYGAAEITVEIFAGPQNGDLQRVGSVTTEREGRGTINLERKLLGSPGKKRLRARFMGNRTFNPVEAQTDFLFATGTRVSLTLAESAIRYESEIRGSGRVLDELGNAVANAPVTLAVGARRLAAALTDDEGRFALEAEGDEIGAGKFNVQAVFDPSEPWYQPSRSEPVQIEVAQPQPVPVTHTLAAFGATALAMVAFLGLRAKPWEAWLARLRRRKRQEEEDSDEPDAPDIERPQVRHGLQPARPSLVSTLRRPHDYDFSGTVRDAVKNRPIAGSLVTLTHPSAEQRRESVDPRGHFTFTDLDSGDWTATCAAHGYVSERFTVTVPHRGELRNVHIDLLPVRERIFSMYRDVAQPLLPDRKLWGIWTPRQIFDYVRQERPTSALSELTDFVEETYFSQRIPAESILSEAESRAQRARDEVAPVPLPYA